MRLHPRRAERAADESKMGGRFSWPAAEAWPRCAEHESPLVTVLQLRVEEMPELGFRPGTDLFQLLWCPKDHERNPPLYAPASQVFWRKRSEVGECLTAPPSPASTYSDYCPTPCVVYPERVTEYPSAAELSQGSPGLWDKVGASRALAEAAAAITDYEFDDPQTLYQYWLSVADGTKVGGYAQWVQDPEVPTCACGTPMAYWLTVASAEFDGGTWGRWLAEEERHVWKAAYEERNAVQSSAGLMLGDMGNLNFFICRRCPAWPAASVFQCS